MFRRSPGAPVVRRQPGGRAVAAHLAQRGLRDVRGMDVERARGDGCAGRPPGPATTCTPASSGDWLMHRVRALRQRARGPGRPAWTGLSPGAAVSLTDVGGVHASIPRSGLPDSGMAARPIRLACRGTTRLSTEDPRGPDAVVGDDCQRRGPGRRRRRPGQPGRAAHARWERRRVGRGVTVGVARCDRRLGRSRGFRRPGATRSRGRVGAARRGERRDRASGRAGELPLPCRHPERNGRRDLDQRWSVVRVGRPGSPCRRRP